jgi:hypothetical protein
VATAVATTTEVTKDPAMAPAVTIIIIIITTTKAPAVATAVATTTEVTKAPAVATAVTKAPAMAPAVATTTEVNMVVTMVMTMMIIILNAPRIAHVMCIPPAMISRSTWLLEAVRELAARRRVMRKLTSTWKRWGAKATTLILQPSPLAAARCLRCCARFMILFAAPSHVVQMDMNSAHLAIMVATTMATTAGFAAPGRVVQLEWKNAQLADRVVMAVVATTMATTAGFAAPSHVAQMDMNSAHLAIMVATAVATAVANIPEATTLILQPFPLAVALIRFAAPSHVA